MSAVDLSPFCFSGLQRDQALLRRGALLRISEVGLNPWYDKDKKRFLVPFRVRRRGGLSASGYYLLSNGSDARELDDVRLAYCDMQGEGRADETLLPNIWQISKQISKVRR